MLVPSAYWKCGFVRPYWPSQVRCTTTVWPPFTPSPVLVPTFHDVGLDPRDLDQGHEHRPFQEDGTGRPRGVQGASGRDPEVGDMEGEASGGIRDRDAIPRGPRELR